MIFKRRSKLFWVEAFVYLAIFVTCVLGSYGVFDAKGAEHIPVAEPVALNSCAEWVKVPALLRIRILRFGMVNELSNLDLGEEIQPLIDCLSQRQHMIMLDSDIVAQCGADDNEALLAKAFETSIKRIAFRCLKWRYEQENFEVDRQTPSPEGAIE